MDAYVALGHLLYGVNSGYFSSSSCWSINGNNNTNINNCLINLDDLFNLFCITSFLQFILFSIFELQLLYGVMQVNQPQFLSGRRMQIVFMMFCKYLSPYTTVIAPKTTTTTATPPTTTLHLHLRHSMT